MWFYNSKKELTETMYEHPVCVIGFKTLKNNGLPLHIIQELIDFWLDDQEMTPVDDSGNLMRHQDVINNITTLGFNMPGNLQT